MHTGKCQGRHLLQRLRKHHVCQRGVHKGTIRYLSDAFGHYQFCNIGIADDMRANLLQVCRQVDFLQSTSIIEHTVGQFRYMVGECERCNLATLFGNSKHTFAQCLYRP